MGWAEQYEKDTCAIAAALSVVGDPWTLLILRDAFLGVRRFEDFRRGLGVARSVLSARLKKLVDYGIMRVGVDELSTGRRDYLITPKGADYEPFTIKFSVTASGQHTITLQGMQASDSTVLIDSLACTPFAGRMPLPAVLKPKPHLRDEGIAAKDIAKMLGVSRATVYRYLAEDACLTA